MIKFFSKLGIFLIQGISKLPFSILYLFSDFLYLLVYKIIGYRTKVVRKNLLNSFPEKSATELKEIEKKFYKNLCDLIVETIKTVSLTEKELLKRFRIVNKEYIDKLVSENRKIFAMQGHYTNWEWPVLGWCTIYPGDSLGIYKPLTNPEFDKMYYEMRSKLGMIPVSMNDVLRTLVKFRNQPYALGIISDQTPSSTDASYWTTFLNQPTAVFLGTEKLAKQFDAAVVFLQLERLKRGFYEMTIVPICEHSKDTSEYEITEKHVRFLESVIKAKPEDWLWSHKRWKHHPTEEILEKFNLK